MIVGGTLKSMLRHPLMMSIIAGSTIISSAMIIFCASFIFQSIEKISYKTGIDGDQLIVIHPQSGSVIGTDINKDQFDAVVQKIRNLPNVQSMSIVNQLPFAGESFWKASVSRHGDSTGLPSKAWGINPYYGDASMGKTLGFHLINGRPFQASEYRARATPNNLTMSGVAYITESFAGALFKNRSAIGNQISIDGKQVTIVATVSDLAGPIYLENANLGVILPGTPFREIFGLFVIVRCKSAAETGLLLSTIKQLPIIKKTSDIQWSVDTYESIYSKYFSRDIWTIRLLSTVMFFVASIGFIGTGALFNFWSVQRLKQTAIRRALGATSRNVLVDYLTEILLISVISAVIASVIVKLFAFQLTGGSTLHINMKIVILSDIGLIFLGLASALKGAWTASRVSPMTALQ